MTPTAERPARRVTVAAFAVSLVAGSAAVVPAAGVARAEAAPRAQQAAQKPGPDGRTSFTAAASCWEIKQGHPNAEDGVYWLVTPTLQAPQRFYCDMTTDGGGWVLIGRGRETWKDDYEGQGTAKQVRSVVTGPDAFRTRQLSSRVIDGLLDGNPVSSLPDGVRVRRATNTAGTEWQEVRFSLPDRDRWVWTFGAKLRVGTFSFDGATGSGGLTRNFGENSYFKRVRWNATRSQDWTTGWAYGSRVHGSDSPTSYLWSSSQGQGNARPFAQVYLRPKLRLTDLDFPSIPDSGTDKQELRPLLENTSLPSPWGVTGLVEPDYELNSEVSAFAQVGDRVYVGGNFRYVQKGPDPAPDEKVEQSFLAAFDADTGNWIRGFRPTFNGQVKALATLPNGLLVAGGDFTRLNGQPAAGVAALDPETGEKSQDWDVQLQNRLTGGLLVVRALVVEGDWLYLGGGFTHLTGGSRDTPVYARGAARVQVGDGTPDPSWNPNFMGSVADLAASPDGSRIYAAGWFGRSGDVETPQVAALSARDASVVDPPWRPTWSSNNDNYQQTVLAAGGRVWVGGSEHSLFSFDPTDFARLSGNITRKGGDFQASAVSDGVVYAGCHCFNWNYSHAFTWPNVGDDFTQADNIDSIGAWDADTGKVLPGFAPDLNTGHGWGLWAAFIDDSGTAWFGGDYTRRPRSTWGHAWAGGFVRFAPRDTTAPGSPSDASVTSGVDGPVLSWQGSTDNRSDVRYEVIRQDRVVATTESTSLDLPSPDGPTRYFVRAVDEEGNRSASTRAVTVAPDPGVALVKPGASWRWRYDDARLSSDWRDVGFDDSGWARGPAVLGFGSESVATDIDVPGGPSTRPLSAQFRHEFQVDDPGNLSAVRLSVVANDGVVVYVNGTEVGRVNMPSGAISPDTFAKSAVRAPEAADDPASFLVPVSLLRSGTNVVSASAHLNYHATRDITFDLSLQGLTGSDGAPAPAAPQVTAKATSATAVEVSWTTDPSSDAVGYRVSRDGTKLAVVSAPASSYSDGAVDPATRYRYQVVAIGPYGNVSESGSASLTTPEDPTLVSYGASWRWRYDDAPLSGDWREVGFDDSGWARDPAVLGFGSSTVATDIDVEGGASQRPLSAQFRHEFDVDDPAALSKVTLSVRADDGAVVYVNGTEVGRVNIPSGPVTPDTYATSAVPTSDAVENPVTFSVPVSLLRTGTNVVAASVHLNYHATRNIGFDVSARGDPA